MFIVKNHLWYNYIEKLGLYIQDNVSQIEPNFEAKGL